MRTFEPSFRPVPGTTLSLKEMIASAERVEQRIAETLPEDRDLCEVASATEETARHAAQQIRKMHGPMSLPKIRLYVTLIALAALIWWIYINYFQVRVVRVAISPGDSVLLSDEDLQTIKFVDSSGSAASTDLIEKGEAEMAFIQAGTQIPGDVAVLGTVRKEHVLFFTRKPLKLEGEIPRVITFNEGQGSHVLGKMFFQRWGYDNVFWLHTWGRIGTDEGYAVPPDVDAIFVVVDPADAIMHRAIERVAKAGFRLQDPDIGVYANHLPYIEPIELDRGYYSFSNPTVPDTDRLKTYTVENYLVAGESVTHQQWLRAMKAFKLSPSAMEFSTSMLHSSGQSLTADLSNILAAAVNLVVIIAALFGIEILLHRRYIHELNSLISRISLLQADHNLQSVNNDKERTSTVFTLMAYADLLGLISTIAGYYSQANAALMFNGLTGAVHTRADTLKLNVQLKLIQGGQAAWSPKT